MKEDEIRISKNTTSTFMYRLCTDFSFRLQTEDQMSADPGQCWSLVREPNHLEPMPWVITNTRYLGLNTCDINSYVAVSLCHCVTSCYVTI